MPKKYAIITDSASDLLQSQCDEYSITVLPMTVRIGASEFKHYCDERELSFKEFYSRLRAGESAGTSAVNPSDWESAMRVYLDAGIDVLVIPFSSALSSTCANAALAAAQLKDEYPDSKIIVVDSLSADFGQGLLVVQAAENQKNGVSIDDNAEWIKNNRLKYCHWFTVDDLHHLRRGGRISAATAVVGSVIGIKPILHVDNEGCLINVGKARGRKKSLEVIIARVGEYAVSPETQTMFISHADCVEDAEYVVREIKARYGVPKIIINHTGPVAGAHSGPGTLAFFFVGKTR